MSINIDALFQHLMEDPDIIPPEGEDKEDIAMAMARQRAKQSNNNAKALSMATDYSNIEKLLAFLVKAEGDTPEDKQFISDFSTHEYNFRTHGKKVVSAARTGRSPWQTRKQAEVSLARKEGRPAGTVEREDETSYAGNVHKKEWEDAYAFLGEHTEGVIAAHNDAVDEATTAGQAAVDDDTGTPTQQRVSTREVPGQKERDQRTAAREARKKNDSSTKGRGSG